MKSCQNCIKGSVYCKCRYFHTARFLHIKPEEKFLCGKIFAQIPVSANDFFFTNIKFERI